MFKICLDNLKYYLHSPESLVADKCLWRNFCDVILLQASKKEDTNITKWNIAIVKILPTVWKN